MTLRPSIFALLALAACGDATSFRPVEIDLQGVSASAARVVAVWFGDTDRECTGVLSAEGVPLGGEQRVEWTPEAPERALRIEPSPGDQGVLVVFSEDASGQVLQCACRVLRYADVERPDRVIRLTDGACRS